jgi:acetyl-CoA acetyltransferase
MRFSRACIPLGYAWSSPFSRWQGALADLNSVDLAVQVTGRALAERDLPAEAISQLILGWTVPQKEIFYGVTTVAARLGATGPATGRTWSTPRRPAPGGCRRPRTG